MFRMPVIIAVVSFATSFAVATPPAFAQKARGGNVCNVDICVSNCQKRGTIRQCDRWCQREVVRRGCQ
jgi:hypothetical protein